MIEKLEMQTKDLSQEKIRLIRELFPNCVTESRERERTVLSVDFDALRQELSDSIVEGPQERYQFTWPDKSKAKRLANTPTTMTLRPYREESVDFDNTKNLYIEGDNLEVLKILRETYLGKVKMIYIDPPYNTGNDFVYDDDFSMSAEDYSEVCGENDDSGNRLFLNTSSNGRFHTDWLNMIYPRLLLMKDYLTDDGVIFISIDENEDSNLRKVCDEIFGSRNFLTELIWNKQHSQQQGIFKRYHEMILVYAKNVDLIENIAGGSGIIEGGAIKKISKSNPESLFSFPAGVRFDAPDGTTITGTYGDSEKMTVVEGQLVANGGKTLYPVVISAGWTQKNQMKSFFDGKETFDTKGQKVIDFFFNSKGKLKCLKERTRITPPSILPEYGTVSKQSEELSNIMGDFVFNNPKPVEMIKDFIEWFTTDEDIVMDCFAGSSTTAQSVFLSNVDNNVNRRFILIQLPELCNDNSIAFKNGYKTIAEIGKERIRRIGITINNRIDAAEVDVGFRVFKCDSSNMKDVYYRSDAVLRQSLDDYIDVIKEHRNSEDLLIQVMLELGIELSSGIEQKDVHGHTIFSVDDGYLIACFDNSIDDSTVVDISKEMSGCMYAVFRSGSSMTDEMLANIEQIFKTYSPQTKIRIL